MTELPVPRTETLSHRILGLKRLLESVDARLARVFVPWAIRHPRHLPAFIRLARTHEHSMRIRARALEGGVRVPPFLVLSVTSRCNLRCAGCFAAAVGTTAGPPVARPPLGLHDWRGVVKESAALGVMGFVIAGGEPFLLPGIANLFRHFSDRLFLVFTNGTALRECDFQVLKSCHNTAVVVSLEGDRDLTDGRRGSGVFERALRCLDRLRAAGVLTGLAVTIGPANIDYWSEERNIDALIARSGPLAFFIEQIPVGECAFSVAMTAEQRSRFRETVIRYRNRKTGGAYIIHSPADEEALGGCVSAGRGFAHVNPVGDVTACPVSALATHNVSTSTLSQAFASPLFTMIRDNGHLLETQGHPCALFANASKLESMANSLGAYRTSCA
ncbi:MAG TPA: radical SAM/SPASM domain-containing protein [Terriglobia bacterium]|nr:radical SAM/SPASM domain-containing protein [Candidatus Acidoferrum sp.]HMD85863.1 radical SAM/SPASM domain-containing protein [Terriglobia bacterium]